MENKDFNDAIKSMPIIAALRGIQESEVNKIGGILLDGGISVFEVPIRTKDAALSEIDAHAIRSIKKLISAFGKHICVAAGTVMQPKDIGIIKEIGVNLCLSPNLNLNVLSEATQKGISFIPGVETVSEAMSAIISGAKGLKIFPAVFSERTGEVTIRHTPGYIRYLSKFITSPIFPSGDAFFDDLPAAYISAGAAGINVGAQLYSPNIDKEELTVRMVRLTNSVRSLL
jgi:2-dehydro-3-deoxyphosphogalactonate aldolase